MDENLIENIIQGYSETNNDEGFSEEDMGKDEKLDTAKSCPSSYYNLPTVNDTETTTILNKVLIVSTMVARSATEKKHMISYFFDQNLWLHGFVIKTGFNLFGWENWSQNVSQREIIVYLCPSLVHF